MKTDNFERESCRVTEDDSNDEKSETEVGRFADEESCATARGRDLVGAITGSADQ